MFRTIRYFSSCLSHSSGHSKWSTIKHRKAAQDATKAAVAFKAATKITIMAKLGGPDPNTNQQLANAIEQAKSMSVTKKVIENAIKRATGENKNGNESKVETVIYEGLGPGGVGIVIEAMTDNKNRTIGFIRPCFSKYQLSLTPTLYMFDKKGLILINSGDFNFDQVFDKVVEFGVEDLNEIESDDDRNLIELVTDPSELHSIASKIKDIFEIVELEISYVPNPEMMVEINDEDTKVTFDKFIRSLDDVDDVSQVYTNLKE